MEANIIKHLDAITTGWWWLLPRECHTIKNKREGKGTNVTRNRRISYPQAWIASREMNWICGELVVKFQIYKNQQLLKCMKFWWTQYRKMSNGWNAWILVWRWYSLKFFITKILSFHFMILAMGSISTRGKFRLPYKGIRYFATHNFHSKSTVNVLMWFSRFEPSTYSS